ncbi:PadR family transcriptional regulator [Bifidobacterium magnum]|uniref:PadR-type transcriptional regulator n=1 Tax=Bifidobacterium magnum TaxID=1692 RepID=A0A087B9Z8_9BIFI|nr:helix-turn-helix transcriptional regulator [Bifidobacterium magnum]KFI67848.1 PadR-type transcriptional regulator [Bifidobacterium magnum]
MNVIELMTLGFVHEEPMCGYQLCNRMRQLLGNTRAFSEGSVHAVTQRLLGKGYLRESNRIVSGRNKRTFHLTPSGYDLLVSTLRNARGYMISDTAQWTVILSFLSTLPNDRDRRAVLERRLNMLENDTHQLYCTDADPLDNSAVSDTYKKAAISIQAAHAQAEIAYLQELLGDNLEN